MAWQGLHLSEPARLSLDARAVRVEQDGRDLRFPLEDVAWIVLDTSQVTLSAALLAACAERGTAVIACDARHMPCGLFSSFHTHHRQAEVLRRQIDIGAPLAKSLWKRIVKRKIANQAAHLRALGRAAEADTLLAMAEHVRSGDPENVEARASRFYWPLMFEGFRRHDEGDRRNALLNYGYALIRAALARALVAHGFLPALGLHHDNAANAFNLADDLIEPYRPFADAEAQARATDAPTGDDLTRDDRRALAGLLSRSFPMGEERLAAIDAALRTAASLARALETKSARALELPRFEA